MRAETDQISGEHKQPVSLCVAIVTYNSANEIESCLSTLFECCPPGIAMTVRVIDNASTDETAAVVSRSRDVIDFRVSTRNDGFAVSTNRSIRGNNADYVLVLNPDTQLRKDVLPRLLEVMSSDPQIGVLGCRLELADGTFDHASKRTFPNPSDAAKYFLQKATRRPSTSSYLAPGVVERGIGEVDAVNGAFMLIRQKAIDQVGLLDEGYWMYAEDLDWCRRFKLANWKVCYDGTVTVIHLKGASSGKYRSLKVNWHFHYSMARFYRKFDGGSNIVLDIAVYLAIGIKFTIASLTSAIKRGSLGRSRSQTLNASARQVS
jgi:N-acetylglucosaminyl-diphospho-decaprenol L-rhamnosyltransferase